MITFVLFLIFISKCDSFKCSSCGRSCLPMRGLVTTHATSSSKNSANAPSLFSEVTKFGESIGISKKNLDNFRKTVQPFAPLIPVGVIGICYTYAKLMEYVALSKLRKEVNRHKLYKEVKSFNSLLTLTNILPLVSEYRICILRQYKMQWNS